jgi:hemimethylated DNA binding protein
LLSKARIRESPAVGVASRRVRRQRRAQRRDNARRSPRNTRPAQDQPFYQLLAENTAAYYGAHVSDQNLVSEDFGDSVKHPPVAEDFDESREDTCVGPKT